MGVQTGHGHLGIFDAHIFASLVSDPDHVQNPVLFDPVADLPQGDVSGNVHHPQVVMGKHHRVFFSAGVGGVNLGMAVEMGVAVGLFTVVIFQRLVHGFFVQGVGAGGVHLAGQRQLDHLFHTLKRGVSAFHADLADGKRLHIGYQLQMQHVDGAGCEQGLAHRLAAVNPDLRMAHEAGRLFDHFGIAHHNGAAAVIETGVRQRFDGNLRPVSGRIAHRNADNRLFIHGRIPL